MHVQKMELIPPLMLVYVLPIPRSCITFEAACSGRLLDRRNVPWWMISSTEVLASFLLIGCWPFPQSLGCFLFYREGHILSTLISPASGHASEAFFTSNHQTSTDRLDPRVKLPGLYLSSLICPLRKCKTDLMLVGRIFSSF